MSLTLLPDTPAEVEFELVDFGGTQSGVLGGSDQRINRLGNRWRMIVTLAPMRPDEADLWAAAIARGLRTGVTMVVPEPDALDASPGAVLVNGAGQAGAALVVDAGTPGVDVRQGKWLSILTGGNRYLYKTAAPATFSGGGSATLQLEPLLRKIPADNDPLTFVRPMIEGLLEVPPGWKIDARRIAAGLTFAIREAR